MRLALVLALAFSSTALAERRMEPGQVYQGPALELHLGSQLFNIAGAGAAIGAVQGGFLVGWKITRVVVGLGIDIARTSTGQTSPGSDSSSADTLFFLSPGVRVAMYRTPDGRVELIGQFDIGFGSTVHEQSPPPTGTQPNVSRFRLNFDIGPGVRYWVHPHFALSGVTGVAGTYAYDSTTIANITTTRSSGVTSIFAALQLLGVF